MKKELPVRRKSETICQQYIVGNDSRAAVEIDHVQLSGFAAAVGAHSDERERPDINSTGRVRGEVVEADDICRGIAVEQNDRFVLSIRNRPFQCKVTAADHY